MNLIVAVDNNWGIGNDGNLLYHIPEDMKFFKQTTLNKVVVMGRKTFESLPGSRALVRRTNIILSSDENYMVEGALVYHNIEGLLNALKAYPPEDIFIIGGKTVYESLLNYCSTAYVTKVNAQSPADKTLINIDKLDNWKLTYTSGEYKHNDLKYTFNTYQNMI